MGHHYLGHNYLGHNYIGPHYMGHSYIGPHYIGHNYLGHNYIGHNCTDLLRLLGRCSPAGPELRPCPSAPSARPAPLPRTDTSPHTPRHMPRHGHGQAARVGAGRAGPVCFQRLFGARPTANAGGLDRIRGCRRKDLGRGASLEYLQIDAGSSAFAVGVLRYFRERKKTASGAGAGWRNDLGQACRPCHRHRAYRQLRPARACRRVRPAVQPRLEGWP